MDANMNIPRRGDVESNVSQWPETPVSFLPDIRNVNTTVY